MLEVYLCLQEPCKASGVLMLPPDILDKVPIDAKAQASTVTYVAEDAKKRRWRRMVLGMLALALIGIGIWGAVTFYRASQGPIPERKRSWACRLAAILRT